MYHTYNIHLEIDPELGYIKNFPFRQRWLRGEEYGFLCRHYYAYSHLIKMFGLKDNDHQEEIYHQPRYGQFYFIKNMHLQFFGFPRRNQEASSEVGYQNGVSIPNSKYKKFKWKKTNFKTCLPKHNPVVIYVTANTKNILEQQCMMHAGTLISGKLYFTTIFIS
jgi:hypothetical protein